MKTAIIGFLVGLSGEAVCISNAIGTTGAEGAFLWSLVTIEAVLLFALTYLMLRTFSTKERRFDAYPITMHINVMRAIEASGREDDATRLFCELFDPVDSNEEYFVAWEKYKSLAREENDTLIFPDGSAYDLFEMRRAPSGDISHFDLIMSRFIQPAEALS